MNITVELVIGNRILSTIEGRFVLADNHQIIGEKLNWGVIAKMPMETTIVFKLSIYAKEGDGFTFGVGALKLFDDNAFLVQGKQEIQLYALEKIEYFKIGCIDKIIQRN